MNKITHLLNENDFFFILNIIFSSPERPCSSEPAKRDVEAKAYNFYQEGQIKFNMKLFK